MLATLLGGPTSIGLAAAAILAVALVYQRVRSRGERP